MESHELGGSGVAVTRIVLGCGNFGGIGSAPELFGSVDEMLAATPEELEGVPGVPAKTARSIYAQLHKTGRG